MVLLNFYGCEWITIDLRLGVAVSRTCLIIADIIVLSLTWRSMRERRFFNQAGQNSFKKTYSAVLLQDGMDVAHDASQPCINTNTRDDLLSVRHRFSALLIVTFSRW